MQFLNLHVHNFLSYREQSFEDIDRNRLTLVSGVNGVGKSAMWDAISWALFGVTARGLKADAVVNRKAKKNCHVALKLSFGGKEYAVERYRKHEEFGDRLRIISKGKVIEKGTLDLTQTWLEREFGIDYELFKCTIMFAQDETFNFVSASNKMQKEILSKIMKIDYDKFLDAAKEELKSVRAEYEKNARDIDILKSNIKEEHELGYKEEFADWENSHSESIDRLKKMMGKKPKAPDTEKLSALRGLKAKIEAKIKELSSKYDEQKSEWHGHRAEVAVIERSLKSMEGLDGECPTCYQEVDADRMGDIRAEKAEKRKKLIAAAEEVAGALEVLKAKIDEHSKNKETVVDRIRKIERDVDSYNVEIERWQEMKEELGLLEAEVNPFIKLIEDEKVQQKEIHKKISELEKQQAKIESDIPYYDFWVKAFGDSGIKSFVFDLICSNLTNRANHYLNAMWNGAISISFDTQKKLKSGDLREKFDCEIIRDGERVDYLTYSGGEKRRISLAVDLALSDIMSDYHGSKFNLLVFDEQTNGMDTAGRKEFMGLLKDLATKKAVFVVDHDAEFKSMFDSVWHVTKKDGFSEVMI